MSKLFIIKSKTYSDDPRKVKDINELRKWMLYWCSPDAQRSKVKCREFAVYSSGNKPLGVVIFSESGHPYWYTVKGGLYQILRDGSLGQKISIRKK